MSNPRIIRHWDVVMPSLDVMGRNELAIAEKNIEEADVEKRQNVRCDQLSYNL